MHIPSLVLRHKWKLALFFGVLLTMGGAYASRSEQDSSVYIPVRVGDVRRTIHTVGMVMADRDMPLRFSSFERVTEVLVKEGQHVKRGQILAKLQTASLAGSVMTASATLQTAQSQFEALQKGARPEDIAVIQAEQDSNAADISHLQQQLEALQNDVIDGEDGMEDQAGTRILNDVSATNSMLSSQYMKMKTALMTIENVFSQLDVQDSIIKSQSNNAQLLLDREHSLQETIDGQMESDIHAHTAADALESLARTRATVMTVTSLLAEAADLLRELPITVYYTSMKQQDATSTLVTQQSLLQEAVAKIDDATKHLQDASATEGADGAAMSEKQEKIRELQAQITALEAASKVTDAQLQLKTAPPLQTDLDQAAARVRRAQGELDRVVTENKNAVLTAPIDGEIASINLIIGQPPPTTEPAMLLRSSAPVSVLVHLSDEDADAITPTSQGTVVFDALPNRSFSLQMDMLSPDTTKIDGINSYRKFDFIDTPSELTVGMSGTVTILLDEHANVLTIPGNLVRKDAEGRDVVRVKRDGVATLVSVVLGWQDDDGQVEVLHGLSEGEVVIAEPDDPSP